jgi:putative hydrolase of the HAD superfamily
MPFPTQPNSPSPAANAAQSVDAVLFDYGMVLSGPPDPQAWALLRSITGLDEDRLHAAYWKFRRDYDRGALSGRAYWQAVAADTEITLDDVQISALAAADIDVWTSLNPPMVEWARQLQRAGVRTGILSNIGDCIGDGVRAKLSWLAGFDQCLWSHALGMAKPDPAIYVKAAEALHTAPEGILFLDDREENVKAAAALGMQTLHYTSHAAFEREMRERGFSSLLCAGLDAPDHGPAHSVPVAEMS